jgi:1,4-alpha-glucan branching enzyme
VAATNAYLAMVPADKTAKSDAYFEGGYELFYTDSELFGGANLGNAGAVMAEEIPHHGRPASLVITLPPLAVVAFKP